MSEPILIGTRGWQQAEWAGDFYPPELPEDWRFCFYSNRLRAALVPGESWHDLNAQAVAQWVEDSDPAFRFVLELPPDWSQLAPGSLAAAFDRFRVLSTPIHSRTAGLVVRATGAPDPAWLAALLDAIGEFRPTAVDLPGAQRTAALQSVCTQRAAGWCWRCAEEEAPGSGGLVVALASAVPPRALRRILEQLNGARGRDGAAALFFEGAQAAKAAEEARILAELMAV